MEYFAKQRWSMKRATARLNIWEGSVRSGKTVATNTQFIKTLPKASKNGEIFLIGKTLDSLKRNIINPMYNLVGDDLVHYPGKREVHLWDRVIYTVGANDERAVGKIQGATIALCLGDEIALWPESFWVMLDSRLSLDTSQLLGTTNPDNPKHFLKKLYLDRKGELDLNSFHFKLDDNPFISDIPPSPSVR